MQVVVAEWLMSERSPTCRPASIRLRRYPALPLFPGVRRAISAVGYNSYHELILAGLPTIFVPNENPQQDDQLCARCSPSGAGSGFCVRTGELYRLQARSTA